MSNGKPWTDTEEQYVRDHWAAESASAIGCQLGKSRNSVIGKIHRLGLPPKSTARTPVHTAKTRAKMSKSQTISRAKAPEKWKEHYPIRAATRKRIIHTNNDNVPPLHKTLLDLDRGECKFPFGLGPYTFCAHPTIDGDSYCPYHNKLTLSRGNQPT